MSDVYVYGMTVLSTIHLLRQFYPAANTYGEIERSYAMPGGEGANCAVVLRNLGVSVALDACLLGDETREPLLNYLEPRGIDCSRLQYRPGFAGWRDLVLCDGQSRTVFGWFGQYLFGTETLWTQPDEDAIRAAQCVALDPFFRDGSAQVAAWCVEHDTPYVTIDCHWDQPMAHNARALVCSQEFLAREYPDEAPEALMDRYRTACRGLVIFTFGSQPLWYASHTTPLATLAPFPVEVVDTLAAGDTFRAGIVYGLLRGMDEAAVVQFASATAAVACTRFPSVYEPPTLAEIEALLAG